MFAELLAYSHRRDANSASPLRSPTQRTESGGECCSAKDSISQLPLHPGGGMALGLTELNSSAQMVRGGSAFRTSLLLQTTEAAEDGRAPDGRSWNHSRHKDMRLPVRSSASDSREQMCSLQPLQRWRFLPRLA